MSALGLAGTSRRGGAGGIGGCWSPGPWRRNPPGPTETILGMGVELGIGWLGVALAAAGDGAGCGSGSRGAATGRLTAGRAAAAAGAGAGADFFASGLSSFGL